MVVGTGSSWGARRVLRNGCVLYKNYGFAAATRLLGDGAMYVCYVMGARCKIYGCDGAMYGCYIVEVARCNVSCTVVRR